jgi:hypothetical protein
MKASLIPLYGLSSWFILLDSILIIILTSLSPRNDNITASNNCFLPTLNIIQRITKKGCNRLILQPKAKEFFILLLGAKFYSL